MCGEIGVSSALGACRQGLSGMGRAHGGQSVSPASARAPQRLSAGRGQSPSMAQGTSHPTRVLWGISTQGRQEAHEAPGPVCAQGGEKRWLLVGSLLAISIFGWARQDM